MENNASFGTAVINPCISSIFMNGVFSNSLLITFLISDSRQREEYSSYVSILSSKSKLIGSAQEYSHSIQSHKLL